MVAWLDERRNRDARLTLDDVHFEPFAMSYERKDVNALAVVPQK